MQARARLWLPPFDSVARDARDFCLDRGRRTSPSDVGKCRSQVKVRLQHPRFYWRCVDKIDTWMEEKE